MTIHPPGRHLQSEAEIMSEVAEYQPVIWEMDGEYYWATTKLHHGFARLDAPAGGPMETFEEAHENASEFFGVKLPLELGVEPDRFNEIDEDLL
jgi:hypothetical protein